MFAEAFPHITESPSLIWVVAAIGLHIVNTFVGTTMAFFTKNRSLVRAHIALYVGILVSLAMFLILNQVHGENTVWDYAIGVYFITLLPVSAKWDALLHAGVATLGLILLPVLILIQM